MNAYSQITLSCVFRVMLEKGKIMKV